ncbi:MAG TPA: aminotransferase class IV [Gemmatimonadales bacterium]|nr:aminotransferase class IV [Gemmatimonadales bacterium]
MATVYLNGQFLPDSQALISPLDRGFTYGDGVYEWIRAYNGKPFLLDEHFARLASSCAKMRIGVHLTPLEDVAVRLLKENGLTGDAAIYIQVTRGTAPRSHVFPPADTKPTVFAMAWAFKPNPAFAAGGAGAIAILEPDVRWSRCDIKVTSLIPNSFSAQRAKELGAHEGLFVRDGVVQEGSLSNFFAVFDGEVRTAPLSNYILPGITRALVLDLCREHGIKCRETPVFATELADADEMFLTSTPYEVVGIDCLDGRKLPAERPITARLAQLYREIVARECA